MNKIKFKTDSIELEGELNNSDTAKKLLKILPLESTINTWGNEIYFNIPLNSPPENATTDVNIGDMAYWPEGNAFCVFFGSTPMSNSDKPVPASKVNIIGKIDSEYIQKLKSINAGTKITLLTEI